jgi:UDP-glucose:(heptosyl)LPS alpha-1,3-glucosyltransferase
MTRAAPPPEPTPLPRLRIAVLNRIFKSTGGGAERYSIALVEQLAERHDIHVFAQHIDHAWPGVTYHSIAQPLHRPRWINQLWFACATWWATRRGFDVVHSHENTWHGLVQTVHVLPVKFNLFTGRHGWRWALRCIKVAFSPRLLVYLALEAARYAPASRKSVVVTSNSLRDKLLQAYPGVRAQTEVITPGLNQVPGMASEAARTAARQALGLPVDGMCLLLVGNDYQKKGLPAALGTLVALPKDFYLAVVGNAQHIATFSALAQSLNIPDRVFFLGALADVTLAYQAANALVHPTLEDTFAMVVLEAMAHGLPVWVSSAQYCGISERLTNGVQAMVLDEPQNSDSLAASILAVFNDANQYAAISEAAVEFAEGYSWSHVARQQELLYRVAAGNFLSNGMRQ